MTGSTDMRDLAMNYIAKDKLIQWHPLLPINLYFL